MGAELLVCPPHVSVEAFLPAAATDSFRACLVEHGFLVETKVLASLSIPEKRQFYGHMMTSYVA